MRVVCRRDGQHRIYVVTRAVQITETRRNYAGTNPPPEPKQAVAPNQLESRYVVHRLHHSRIIAHRDDG